MRTFFLLVVAATTSVASLACSTRTDGTAEPERITPPAMRPVACAPREESLCDGVERVTADSPPSAGSIAWAQVITSPTAEGRAAGTPKVALYEDGTLRRTSFVRNLTYFLTPPRGLALARVEPSSVARIRADVAAIHDADLRAFFGPEENVAREASRPIDIVRVPDGSACFFSARSDARSQCAAAASLRLSDDLAALASAAEVKWRGAQTGTISIGSYDVSVRGEWPLADDRAVEGSITFTHAEWSKVGQTGIYRLHDGGYVEIDLATEAKGVEGGDVTAFSSRKSVVTIGDDLSALRTELLANGGRYELSRGEWLGIALSADRFPMFKNHDYVALPVTNETPAGLRPLYAIETLDLRAEGPISLP